MGHFSQITSPNMRLFTQPLTGLDGGRKARKPGGEGESGGWYSVVIRRRIVAQRRWPNVGNRRAANSGESIAWNVHSVPHPPGGVFAYCADG
jgi:hypothetical protein